MSTSTIASLAREHGISAPLVGYQGPDTIYAEKAKVISITAPGDHTVKGEPTGLYEEGDLVDPFDMSAAHLRIAASYRTPSGHMSAEAKLASKELARRSTNRPAKKARQSAIVEALAAGGFLD